jgi:hypothetical protein
MRKPALALAAALGLSILIGGLALAQVQKCPGWTDRPQTGCRARPCPGPAPEARLIEGEVAAVLPAEQVVSLAGPGGRCAALQVGPRTTITFPDGSLASLGDIGQGARVRAAYRQDETGRLLAERIHIVSMAPGG